MKNTKRPKMPEVLVTIGAAALSAGVALVYVPAGLICAGVLLIVAGVVSALGGDSP